jgi:hypothetical protein
MLITTLVRRMIDVIREFTHEAELHTDDYIYAVIEGK